jgi:glycosyltransferase involved in cell wall biosynthesis
MHLTVALDARYTLAPDGSVWSQVGMARAFWQRYLEVFDSVRIIARATRVEKAPEGWLQVNGKNILFHPVPDYQGPRQFLKRYPAIQAAIRSAAPKHGAVILRVGSQIANMLEASLVQINRPFALEVVGDPYDVFAPGVVDHPLRPFFRWHFSRSLRRQCLRAIGVAYVTKRVLQQRYPTLSLADNISDVELPNEAILKRFGIADYSSVELEERDIAPRSREKISSASCFKIVTVGSLEQLYKGTDVLIEALACCLRSGFDLRAVIVGNGKYRTQLIEQAERLGIDSRIEFTGQVTAGDLVRQILDSSDLFVLPSRTEGLPRALIEAMARGLPCIGSDAGGVSELLEPQEMVPAGDPVALSKRIQEVLTDPMRMERLSKRNLEVSMQYASHILAERRRRFYTFVRDRTHEFDGAKGPI